MATNIRPVGDARDDLKRGRDGFGNLDFNIILLSAGRMTRSTAMVSSGARPRP
jgi:hypothetical protein